jgi:hypothetical protein
LYRKTANNEALFGRFSRFFAREAYRDFSLKEKFDIIGDYFTRVDALWRDRFPNDAAPVGSEGKFSTEGDITQVYLLLESNPAKSEADARAAAELWIRRCWIYNRDDTVVADECMRTMAENAVIAPELGFWSAALGYLEQYRSTPLVRVKAPAFAKKRERVSGIPTVVHYLDEMAPATWVKKQRVTFASSVSVGQEEEVPLEPEVIDLIDDEEDEAPKKKAKSMPETIEEEEEQKPKESKSKKKKKVQKPNEEEDDEAYSGVPSAAVSEEWLKTPMATLPPLEKSTFEDDEAPEELDTILRKKMDEIFAAAPIKKEKKSKKGKPDEIDELTLGNKYVFSTPKTKLSPGEEDYRFQLKIFADGSQYHQLCYVCEKPGDMYLCDGEGCRRVIHKAKRCSKVDHVLGENENFYCDECAYALYLAENDGGWLAKDDPADSKQNAIARAYMEKTALQVKEMAGKEFRDFRKHQLTDGLSSDDRLFQANEYSIKQAAKDVGLREFLPKDLPTSFDGDSPQVKEEKEMIAKQAAEAAEIAAVAAKQAILKTLGMTEEAYDELLRKKEKEEKKAKKKKQAEEYVEQIEDVDEYGNPIEEGVSPYIVDVPGEVDEFGNIVASKSKKKKKNQASQAQGGDDLLAEVRQQVAKKLQELYEADPDEYMREYQEARESAQKKQSVSESFQNLLKAEFAMLVRTFMDDGNAPDEAQELANSTLSDEDYIQQDVIPDFIRQLEKNTTSKHLLDMFKSIRSEEESARESIKKQVSDPNDRATRMSSMSKDFALRKGEMAKHMIETVPDLEAFTYSLGNDDMGGNDKDNKHGIELYYFFSEEFLMPYLLEFGPEIGSVIAAYEFASSDIRTKHWTEHQRRTKGGLPGEVIEIEDLSEAEVEETETPEDENGKNGDDEEEEEQQEDDMYTDPRLEAALNKALNYYRKVKANSMGERVTGDAMKDDMQAAEKMLKEIRSGETVVAFDELINASAIVMFDDESPEFMGYYGDFLYDTFVKYRDGNPDDDIMKIMRGFITQATQEWMKEMYERTKRMEAYDETYTDERLNRMLKDGELEAFKESEEFKQHVDDIMADYEDAVDDVFEETIVEENIAERDKLRREWIDRHFHMFALEFIARYGSEAGEKRASVEYNNPNSNGRMEAETKFKKWLAKNHPKLASLRYD